MLVPVVVFVAVVGIVLGAYWFIVAAPESREQAALRRRLKDEDKALAKLRLLKEEQPLSEIDILNQLLTRFSGLSTPLQRRIDESGLTLKVGTFVLGTVAGFLLLFVGVNWFTGIWILGLVAGAVGAMVPSIVVNFARTRRLNKFEEQFPEAIELIARSLRAGHAFATGLKIASDELPAPAGPEFKMLFERQNYGAALGDALRAFAQRIPLVDARFFVTAVLTQRETGGNLSEVLDRLAAVMRERFKVRREVRVRSAHGRMTAYVLAGLPPGLAVLTLFSNPDQMKILFSDPLGIRMVIAAVVLQVLGTLIVRKMVHIEY